MNKKFLLLIIIYFAPSFFASQNNEYSDQDLFISTKLEEHDIQNNYNNFLEEAENNCNNLKKLKQARNIFFVPTKLLNYIVQTTAEMRGYNNFSQQQITIGELFFQEESWQDNTQTILYNITPKHLDYLNTTKDYIQNAIKSNTFNLTPLNCMIYCLHKKHVDALADEEHFDDNYTKSLLENTTTNNVSTFYDHLTIYKEQKGKLPPYIALNMFLTYMFKKHKIVTEE